MSPNTITELFLSIMLKFNIVNGWDDDGKKDLQNQPSEVDERLKSEQVSVWFL